MLSRIIYSKKADEIISNYDISEIRASVIKKYILKEIENAIMFGREIDEDMIKIRIHNSAIFDFKEALLFHGGCLSCTTPYHETIDSCYDCVYLRGVTSGFKDKSRKYDEESE